MKQYHVKSLVLGLVLGAGAVLGIAAVNDPMPVGSEYRVVFGSIADGNLQEKLNKAAAEGWKLEGSDSFTGREAYAVMSKTRRVR